MTFGGRSLLLLLLLCLAGATCVQAATRSWPGVAPCAGTLQACINGAAEFDTVQIKANTINENVYVENRNLTLMRYEGYLGTFAPGRFMQIYGGAGAGDLQVSIQGLRFVEGGLTASYAGTGVATYELRDSSVTCVTCSSLIRNVGFAATGGTLNVILYNNSVSTSADVPLSIRGVGATLNANLQYNRIASTESVGTAGLDYNVGSTAGGLTAGSGNLTMHANDIRGSFILGAIRVGEGYSGPTASSVVARLFNNVTVCGSSASFNGGSGIELDVSKGAIDAQIVNNTVTRCYIGMYAGQNSGGAPGANINGQVTNNLVIANIGLEFDIPPLVTLSNDYNLLDVTSNDAAIVLGAHTILAPAQVVLPAQPRLRATSPAIDSASTTFGTLLLAGIPNLDADGLRRFKGALGKADIGAYEFGDATFAHVPSANTIVANTSVIDNAALNNQASSALVATPNYKLGAPAGGAYEYTHPFGAYFNAPAWALFNEDSLNPMPLGAAFDVFVPAAGAGSFVHASSIGSIGGFATTFSDPVTDGIADAIVLVTQNWSAGGAGLYNPHPIGVYYGGGFWHVANLDNSAMSAALGFNLYAQAPSPNAFRATSSTYNTASSISMRLDHPLLNGTPCALPQVTRVLGAGDASGSFNIGYGVGAWYIVANTGVISSGDQFDVLVDPAQVFECIDRIFRDGFD
jgi:hypothetical protein